MIHSLSGLYLFIGFSSVIDTSTTGLVKPIRAVAFSPKGKLLAAAGHSNAIALYDAISGEQIAILTGHSGWIFSLSWSETGQYLLSGSVFQTDIRLLLLTPASHRSFDGKAKVWSIDQKTCVATHSESDQGLFAVRWLPRVGLNEGFVTAGANKNIAFYREAMGG